MFALSRTKNPLSGLGQRIATIALVILALIAAIALLTRGSGSGESSGGSSSGFTPQTYSSGSSSPGQTSSDADSAGKGDGLNEVRLAELPRQAQATVALIDAGGPFPYSRDGVVFANRERLLPRQAKGWYHEYTVKTPGSADRGARRVITGKDGAMYYTADHYETFRRIVR